jgi:hypothetical protein
VVEVVEQETKGQELVELVAVELRDHLVDQQEYLEQLILVVEEEILD